ncbi:EamA family transporter RarD [Moraxella oblonga]|uniref:EamA family transporter RarD n=1 Tax=Moraxella oblonga TaxID=200413 RepID=UPI000832E64D|nr:EamA family transporter RarD [Moraxella oblonga]
MTKSITHPKLYPTTNTVMKGVILAVLSNVMFAMVYAYGKWLPALTGTNIFYWRMVMMWVCLVGLISLLGKWRFVLDGLSNVKGVKGWLWLLIPTPIFASQLWLFVYAPMNGYGVALSMGYFLLPLMMVLVGFVMGERLTRLQWLAVAFAGVGVGVEILRIGQISWATFWVCLTYPVFYVMRRKQNIPALTGLFVDTSLVVPVCLTMLMVNGSDTLMVLGSGIMLLKVLGLGLISVVSQQANLEANRLLPTSLFGLLGYLEPALLFILAVTLLGGVFEWQMLGSFGLIWLGIACLLVQGVAKQMRRVA